MLPGDTYPEINQAGGGYTLPLNASSQGTHAQAKKYVVGSPEDNNGKSAAQASANNTYIMRYADVLLIEAEAIMGQAANVVAGSAMPLTTSTTDATALGAINQVRKRAGLPDLTSLTYRQLLAERRLEFALEQDYWFDLCRLDGFNSPTHPTAIAIISAQDRGDSSAGTEAAGYKDFTKYGNGFYTPANARFLFPVPINESTSNPNLIKAPVPYIFK
jgi:hypothetical protein